MRLKWQMTMLLLCIMLLSSVTFASEVTLIINDQPIGNDDLIIVQNDQLYACVADFSLRYGGETHWFDNAKLAVVNYQEKYMSFELESSQVIINNETLTMEAPTINVNNRVYAPLNFLIEQLSGTFIWNDRNLTLTIQSDQFKLDEADKVVLTYTDEDLLWLSRIIDVEGRSTSPAMKLAIANVVLNRVKSASFPATVYDVIYQEGNYKQFPPAHKSSFLTLEPSKSSIVAAKKALTGENNVGDCLYFNNRPFSSKADDLYTIIDGEYFYK
ncbi:cell wall hydrolase [Fusibacter sp. 3D3]|uniref:cell wall hydrolase n=1 Tax=Fusibacter sp. 3D3 TaxID=1048380 RepID=UPI000852CAD7|nr:cell wall hydrolase [Fusibacter sp. 3D3]GAU75522.1 spore cortex-lytic enzyme [Fusibacter sp. 3D3]